MFFNRAAKRERNRGARIALDIWKKKPAKDAEWYKTVGQEIAAEIMGVAAIGPFGILVVVDESLEEDEFRLVGSIKRKVSDAEETYNNN